MTKGLCPTCVVGSFPYHHHHVGRPCPLLSLTVPPLSPPSNDQPACLPPALDYNPHGEREREISLVHHFTSFQPNTDKAPTHRCATGEQIKGGCEEEIHTDGAPVRGAHREAWGDSRPRLTPPPASLTSRCTVSPGSYLVVVCFVFNFPSVVLKSPQRVPVVLSLVRGAEKETDFAPVGA